MFLVLLTQSTAPIIGPISKFFGVIIDYIYNFVHMTFGLESIGVTIILFTIITRLLMLPLAFKQQKSMREMQKIQPEMKKIQDKYKGKKDQESQQKMQMEISQLYQKHGVNPFGGCLPLLIQLPIIWALFQVLRNIPAYVGSVRQIYVEIIEKVSGISGINSILVGMNEGLKPPISNFDPNIQNQLIDLFGKFNTEHWNMFFEKMPNLSDILSSQVEHINNINYMLGINLADNPNLLSIGVLIPILNIVAQLIVSKISMAPTSNGNEQSAQANKTMMYTMPFITGFFVISMPAGLGLYWLISTLFQLGQQIVINKHLEEKNV